MKKLAALLFVLFTALPAIAVEGGSYVAFKAGWQKSVQKTQTGMIAPDEVKPNELMPFQERGKDGFAVQIAVGANLEAGLPVWFSTELELGFQRHNIGITIGDNAAELNLRVQILSFMVNGAVHFLDIYSPHNLFVGAGIGGGFSLAKVRRQDESVTADEGTSILLQATIGYDYRLLERSQFSSESLRVGLVGRYVFTEGFSQEHLAQAMVVLTYGF